MRCRGAARVCDETKADEETKLHAFDDERDALPDTNTHGAKRVAPLDALELIERSRDESRKDPARRILSMNQIGLCFFQKNWLADAIDVFSQAIDDYEMKDDALGKELRYNLGRAYEAKGDAAKALEIYRKIAQADFAYKDISERVSRLRAN